MEILWKLAILLGVVAIIGFILSWQRFSKSYKSEMESEIERIKSYTTPEDRELTAEETTLLQYLLSSPNQALEPYRRQIPFVRVVGSCNYGCGTIDLKLKPGAIRGAVPSGGEVAKAYGNSPSGCPVDIILHQNGEGELSELEIVWYNDPKYNDPISKWIPQPTELNLGRRPSKS